MAVILSVASFSQASVRRENLSMRQPTKGAAAYNVARAKAQFSLTFTRAMVSAESLDKQIAPYLKASSMGILERWHKNIDLNAMRAQYSQKVLIHLNAMAELMKMRNSQGESFKKLHEFQFQNLLRKSDYVLAVSTTQECLQVSSENSDFAAQVEKAITAYKQARK